MILTHPELMATYRYLLAILENSKELAKGSLLVEMQLSILGEVLVKKIHPKIILVKPRHKIKLTHSEVLAFQRGVYVSWPSMLCASDQYKILQISYEKLPQVVVQSPNSLLAIDRMEEE